MLLRKTYLIRQIGGVHHAKCRGTFDLVDLVHECLNRGFDRLQPLEQLIIRRGLGKRLRFRFWFRELRLGWRFAGDCFRIRRLRTIHWHRNHYHCRSRLGIPIFRKIDDPGGTGLCFSV